MARRTFLRRGITWVSLTALAGTAYTTLVEPAWLEITHMPLTLPRLDTVFNGYRIVQISDIHLGDWMNADRLRDVVRAVNAQSPDLIAITGDFVTRHPETLAETLASGLKSLNATDGAFAVMGNHDHWSNVQIVRNALTVGGIQELRNTAHTIHRGAAALHVGGVDDIWEGLDQLEQVLAAIPANGAAILLAHEPDFADQSAATGRFDLQLSGHSHGGQLVMPFIGPLHVPYLGRKYPSGRYQVGKMIQYTNRGVGMIRPFVRLNCRPEITVFHLFAPDNRGAASPGAMTR